MIEVILLTHKGCPVCPMARQFWEDLRSKCAFEYKDVEVYTPEGLGFIKKFGIRKVNLLLSSMEKSNLWECLRKTLRLTKSDVLILPHNYN